MRAKGSLAVLVGLLAAVLLLAVPSSGMAWTSLGEISDTNPYAAMAPAVAMSSTGTSAVAWRRLDGTSQYCCYRIQVRRIAKSGGLGHVLTLSPQGESENAGPPQLAMDPQGDAYVVWATVPLDCGLSDCSGQGGNGKIEGRLVRANGTLGPLDALRGDPKQADPQVGMDAAGDAVVVWQEIPDLGWSNVLLRARSADGTLGGTYILTPAGFHGDPRPQIAVSPNGESYVTWTETNYSGGPPHRIQGRARHTDGTFGLVQAVSGPDTGPESRVGIDSHGNALIAWRDDGSQETGRIRVRRHAASGALGPVQTLSASEALDNFRLGVNSTGAALLAWQASSGPVRVRGRSSNGTLGLIQTLATPGALKDLAVNGAGAAAIVWMRSGYLWATHRDANGQIENTRLFNTKGRKDPVVALGDSDLTRVAFQHHSSFSAWTIGATADP